MNYPKMPITIFMINRLELVSSMPKPIHTSLAILEKNPMKKVQQNYSSQIKIRVLPKSNINHFPEITKTSHSSPLTERTKLLLYAEFTKMKIVILLDKPKRKVSLEIFPGKKSGILRGIDIV